MSLSDGTLWTLNNAKGMKGLAHGWLTAVLHLAPGNLSGTEMCARRSPGCTFACLNLAGCGPTRKAQESRIARTRAFVLNEHVFVGALLDDLNRLEVLAHRRGLRLAARPNGTSDRYDLARTLAEREPGIQFYDYTKLERPWERVLPNYHLTFSRSEANEGACLAALAHGVNVAVVFAVRKGRPLPERHWGRPIVDGDLHDLRFLDPSDRRGLVIGLRAKGHRAQQCDTRGFVVDPNEVLAQEAAS